ncbi:MAG: ferredoxin--NADP reductase [Melioribacteraceae bacterium]|nr:ferredoxin--NADP reductase [Melioribacteraceae bacterium]
MNSYLELDIIKIDEIADETNYYLLKANEENDFSFLPGQFLTLIFNDNGEEIRRAFSICTTPDELPYLGIAIKKVRDGFTSNFIMDNLKVGDKISALPPLGIFILNTQENVNTHIFIGAGSGITPLISMMKAELKRDTNSRVILFYGNRNEKSIIFRNEIDELKRIYNGRFDVYNSLTQPSENWDGHNGRIDFNNVKEYLSKNNLTEFDNSDYYLCGPSGMMKNIISGLEEHGVNHEKIHKENYEISIIEDAEEYEERDYSVTVIHEGVRHNLLVKAGDSILYTALEHGIDLPNSCQFGSCGTCKATLLSGKIKLVDQSVLSEEEKRKGYCLTCVGYPLSENVVIHYDDRF